MFKQIGEDAPPPSPPPSESAGFEGLGKLTAGEISAICSSLSKGCEKQRLNEETEAFNILAAYFKSLVTEEKGSTLDDAAKMLNDDLSVKIAAANKVAAAEADRGALRCLVWSEKVSVMQKALIERYAKEGDAMLKDTGIYVCDICGFIHIGGSLPDICPVCKVPNYRIDKIERR